MSAFTHAQLDLLRMFGTNLSDADLVEIKKLVADYLSKKVVQSANQAFEQKGYTDQDVENWKSENMRSPGK